MHSGGTPTWIVIIVLHQCRHRIQHRYGNPKTVRHLFHSSHIRPHFEPPPSLRVLQPGTMSGAALCLAALPLCTTLEGDDTRHRGFHHVWSASHECATCIERVA
jgi:hypothetical protein